MAGVEEEEVVVVDDARLVIASMDVAIVEGLTDAAKVGEEIQEVGELSIQ
jgi:hypothetical protein